MIARTEEDIRLIKKSGSILARVLNEVAEKARPGITTKDLNKLARELILSYGATPAFEGYFQENSNTPPYPAALCTSVNDEIVHAVPGHRLLKEGDIIGLDLGVEYKGYFTDMAVTVGVGKIGKQAQQLITATRESLEKGISKVKAGNHIGDIGAAVSSHVKTYGFSVVRQLVGHGVGGAVHEDPQVPNYGRPKTGELLVPGMILAIEPMVNVGDYQVKASKDGFGFKTIDKSLSAHFEHTVMVTKSGCEVITREI